MSITKAIKFFVPTFIFLVVLEFAARILDLPPYANSNERGMYMESESYDFRLTPGYSGKLSALEYKTDVLVNNQGFRDTQNGDFDIDQDKKKVLFIGDSMTFGQGVEYEDSFVGRFLQSDVYFPINAGVPAYGTTHSLEQLKKIGSDIKPDYVVYTMFPGNDFYDTARGFVKYVIDGYLTEDYPPEMPESEIRKEQLSRGVPETTESTASARFPTITYFDISKVPDTYVIDSVIYSETKTLGFLDKILVKTSNLYRFLRFKALFVPSIKEKYGKRGVVDLSKCSFPYSKQTFHVEFPRAGYESRVWDVTTSQIVQMKDFVENELGAKFIVGLIPAKEQVNKKLWDYERAIGCIDGRVYDINRPEKLLVDFFKDQNIDFVTTTTSLQDEISKGKDPFYKIDSHINKIGHEIVFGRYKEALERL